MHVVSVSDQGDAQFPGSDPVFLRRGLQTLPTVSVSGYQLPAILRL